ncbi:MAG: hypothetical protein AAFV49_18540 [Pseudomonadota bacterium]
MEPLQDALMSSLNLPTIPLGLAVISAGLVGYGIGRRANAGRLKALQGEMLREMRRMRRQRDDLQHTVREQDGEINRSRRKRAGTQPAALSAPSDS